MLLAGDFRDSTPDYTVAALKAMQDAGVLVIYLGNVATPTLAYYCQKLKVSGIMITGSHTEGKYNGLKLYDIDGEVLNEADIEDGDLDSDRNEIMAEVENERQLLYKLPQEESIFDEPEGE